MIKITWSLGTDCTGKFKVGDKVKTRGDFGGFNLVVVQVHNGHFAACRGYGKVRHFNMNTLEHRKPIIRITDTDSECWTSSPRPPTTSYATATRNRRWQRKEMTDEPET
jgi:hypothetical protein